VVGHAVGLPLVDIRWLAGCRFRLNVPRLQQALHGLIADGLLELKDGVDSTR
jgi:hypothetical protein